MELVQYVGLSAQLALENRLESVARNVANLDTAGYRAEGTSFSTVLSLAAGHHSVAYVSPGNAYFSDKAGPVTRTDNPLDVAVEGDGWLGMQTPAGTAYTRDGRMHMLQTGELVTLAGYPVLDAGGAPILLDPNGGPPEIARDGMITQSGAQLGAIGLFRVDVSGGFARYDNSGIIPDRPATPVLDFTGTSVRQGYVEGSNVDPMMELTRLITISRAFENASSSIEQSDSTLREAIRTLGQTS